MTGLGQARHGRAGQGRGSTRSMVHRVFNARFNSVGTVLARLGEARQGAARQGKAGAPLGAVTTGDKVAQGDGTHVY